MTLKEFRELLVKKCDRLHDDAHELTMLFFEFSKQAKAEGKGEYGSTNNKFADFGHDFAGHSPIYVLFAIRDLARQADKEEEAE